MDSMPSHALFPLPGEPNQVAAPLLDARNDDTRHKHIQHLLDEAERRLRPESLRAFEYLPGSRHPSPSGRAGAGDVDVSPQSWADFSHIRLQPGSLPVPYSRSTAAVARASPSSTSSTADRCLSGRPRQVEDPLTVKERLAKDKSASAGSDWFNMPRTNLTPELQRDLQLLRMRSVLDPKRHYKKENRSQALVPEFSEVGTLIEGATEFYSARLPNKSRKKTLVDETLSTNASMDRFRRKYNDIQDSKRSGKKAFYKKLKARRA
ncbi:MAG: hypothetical protein M1833_005947 [Piccolia ochrophora]|nr:MAG: hypothetical protein M1833_005947 [Piccolia ochrophora]